MYFFWSIVNIKDGLHWDWSYFFVYLTVLEAAVKMMAHNYAYAPDVTVYDF